MYNVFPVRNCFLRTTQINKSPKENEFNNCFSFVTPKSLLPPQKNEINNFVYQSHKNRSYHQMIINSKQNISRPKQHTWNVIHTTESQLIPKSLQGISSKTLFFLCSNVRRSIRIHSHTKTFFKTNASEVLDLNIILLFIFTCSHSAFYTCLHHFSFFYGYRKVSANINNKTRFSRNTQTSSTMVERPFCEYIRAFF